MDLFTALETRRSIRRYTEDPVPEEKIIKILNAARIAPSWSNLQCWKFIVIRDAGTREKLSSTLPETNPAVKAMARAPVAIVMCGDPKASGRIDGKEYYLLDGGIAMQQLVLAAHAEGLGTCWVALFDEEKARQILNVPDTHKIVAMTPLGFPDASPNARPRKELAEIVFAEQWGRVYLS